MRSISTNELAGRLYVVATPIGNLGDFTPRAREVLGACACVAAEDTRHSGALLRQCGITTPLISLHDHNETQRTPELLRRLTSGDSVALISDAGTPAISDPGFELVRTAAAAGIEIVAVPGPCAAIAALSIGGLPTDRFCFEGFLPARAAARVTRLQALEQETRTMVFYESPHRLKETLQACAAAFGADRPAVAAREITKLHESVYRGTLGELMARALEDADLARGELVLLIAGTVASPGGDKGADGHGGALDRILKVLMAELPLKQAAALAAKLLEDVRDNEAYKRALVLKQAGE